MVVGVTGVPLDSPSSAVDGQGMPDITFDRRVSDELMAALGPDGFAHSLVEYAHSGQYGLDLGLRSGRPKSTRSWATLYAGTTKALDLVHQPGKGFKLDVHHSWQDKVANSTGAWHDDWQAYRSGDDLAERWTQVEAFIEACIDQISKVGSHLREGTVQAGVSRFPAPRWVIDREVVMGFASKPIKQHLLAQQRQPLADALQQAVSPDIPWLTPDLSSTECDALAITPDGNLLAIEIKPGAVGSAAAKSPLQAWQYARQIQAWVDQPNPLPGSDPVTVLRGMYAQRRQLGLLHGGSPEDPPLADHPRVIPAIAIRPRHSPEVKNRLRLVAELLASDPALSAPPMQFYLVNLVGRLDTFDPFEPGSW